MHHRKEKAHASEGQPATTTVPMVPGLPPRKALAGQMLGTPSGEQEAVTISDCALLVTRGEKQELRPKYNFPFCLPRSLSLTSRVTHYIGLGNLRLL